MKAPLILMCFLVPLLGYSQISFTEQSEVKNLMERYISLGKSEDQIDGWRIKLVSTTDRRKMESTRYRFQSAFPEMKAYSKYENPYYSLTAGAFETRFDLEPMLVKIKETLPAAIPFRDRIEKTELFE